MVTFLMSESKENGTLSIKRERERSIVISIRIKDATKRNATTNNNAAFIL